MICEKCGTENKEGTSYCKKCGEDLFEKTVDNTEVIAEETSEHETVEAVKEEETSEQESERVRTSPLAVRMQEKNIKEDKKIKAKIKRGKVWAAIAAILAVLIVAENAALIYIGKQLDLSFNKEEVVNEDVENTDVIVEEPAVLGTETLSGNWLYNYSLTKYWDDDVNGEYDKVTETIISSGQAGFVDMGNNHMGAIVNPGEMIVDGEVVALGNTPEAFSSWYEAGFICIQMKGTEQKFFAPGGAEPLVIKVPVSMDETGTVQGGTFEHTYEKVVSEMNMRYVISVTLNKN